MIDVQRPIKLCDGRLFNLLGLQNWVGTLNTKEALAFDLTRDGKVCAMRFVRVRMRPSITL
jgi:hypothetical protein